jgi:hypothetical protein
MRDFNAFQTLSLFGLLFSVIVQILLTLIHKHVDTIWALYPTWFGVFIFGTILKKFTKEDHHH